MQVGAGNRTLVFGAVGGAVGGNLGEVTDWLRYRATRWRGHRDTLRVVSAAVLPASALARSRGYLYHSGASRLNGECHFPFSTAKLFPYSGPSRAGVRSAFLQFSSSTKIGNHPCLEPNIRTYAAV